MTHYQYSRYISGVDRAFQKFLKIRLQDVDLQPLEFRILLIIMHWEGISQEEIAESMTIDKSVIARKVKGMTDNDYVMRKVNETDRRAYRLYRTEKAIAFKPAMMEILAEWEDIVLEKVPEEERDHFSALMEMVYVHAKTTVNEIQQEEER